MRRLRNDLIKLKFKSLILRKMNMKNYDNSKMNTSEMTPNRNKSTVENSECTPNGYRNTLDITQNMSYRSHLFLSPQRHNQTDRGV